jgi:hypothetical protein
MDIRHWAVTLTFIAKSITLSAKRVALGVFTVIGLVSVLYVGWSFFGAQLLRLLVFAKMLPGKFWERLKNRLSTKNADVWTGLKTGPFAFYELTSKPLFLNATEGGIYPK